jgi:hypothetical protein
MDMIRNSILVVFFIFLFIRVPAQKKASSEQETALKKELMEEVDKRFYPANGRHAF